MKAIKYLLVIAVIFCITVPAMAGNGPGGGGGGGGGPVPTPTPTDGAGGGGSGDIPDTGELYGDLYVILRDEFGVPILSAAGCIQPISAVTGSTIIATIDGDVEISVLEGEPFALPTYTDTAGDLVECELTEDMATWVQAVDFGRLNLGRAPESVLAHAFDEAINKLNVATAIKLDPAGRLVLTLPDEATGDLLDKTIDAPAENLALYIEMMMDGDWITEDPNPISMGGPPAGKGPPEGDGPSSELRPVLSGGAITLLDELEFVHLGFSASQNTELNNQELLLAASLLAAAADKTGNITLDKVMYINSVYGINQAGSLPGEAEGKLYFDFGAFGYGNPDGTGRGVVYGSTGNRGSVECGMGWIWVLQPELEGSIVVPNHFVTQCMEILGYEAGHDPLINAVRFTDMVEAYTTIPYISYFTENVRGFAQAADDALQVIEYVHNYKVPEVLYP